MSKFEKASNETLASMENDLSGTRRGIAHFERERDRFVKLLAGAKSKIESDYYEGRVKTFCDYINQLKGYVRIIQFKMMKYKHPDAILLFQVDNWYVSYHDDAKAVSDICGITLNCNGGSKKAAFPAHTLDIYLPKLIRAGKRVAICDVLRK